jgi:hypothetical protein
VLERSLAWLAAKAEALVSLHLQSQQLLGTKVVVRNLFLFLEIKIIRKLLALNQIGI